MVPNLFDKLDRIINLPGIEPTEALKLSYYANKSFRSLSALTSKEIRTGRSNKEPICIFKIGLILTPNESLNWLNNVKKLTSTKLKDVAL